jgi:hypothetical protein
MANTLVAALQLAIENAGLRLSANPSNNITLVGNNLQGNVQAIGTSSEIITLTDVGSSGYVFLKNLDATNFVSIAQTNPAVAAAALVKLLPGEWCFIPTPLTAIYAIADTGSVDLQIIFAER